MFFGFIINIFSASLIVVPHILLDLMFISNPGLVFLLWFSLTFYLYNTNSESKFSCLDRLLFFEALWISLKTHIKKAIRAICGLNRQNSMTSMVSLVHKTRFSLTIDFWKFSTKLSLSATAVKGLTLKVKLISFATQRKVRPLAASLQFVSFAVSHWYHDLYNVWKKRPNLHSWCQMTRVYALSG